LLVISYTYSFGYKSRSYINLLFGDGFYHPFYGNNGHSLLLGGLYYAYEVMLFFDPIDSTKPGDSVWYQNNPMNNNNIPVLITIIQKSINRLASPSNNISSMNIPISPIYPNISH
jgi:hypothetical protein